MRIFLAGATGVVGSRVIPQLINAGHDVTAVVRSDSKSERVRALGAVPAVVDLFDRPAVDRAVAGHETVINLATHVPPSSGALFPGAWREMNEVRKHVPRNLAAAARETGVKRFIQESFAPVYPDMGDQWIDETAPLATAGYNRAVVDAESAVDEFRVAGGDGITLRFAYFYGADSDFTRDMIRFTQRGWAATPGRKDAYVSSISHDDAATAVIAALTLPSATYNVCDDEPVTHAEFFNSLADLLSVRRPRFAPAWTKWLMGSIGTTLARSQRISNRRLRALGWKPTLPSIREGWVAVLKELPAEQR